MSTSNSVRRAVRYALLTSAAALVTLPAQAQEQTIQEVVVTGSRIAVPNMQSISPVSSITDEDIAVAGATRIEDIINRLPQAFSAQGAMLSNDSEGTATINLRGLGESRTLVLINGRRLGPGDPSSDTFAADVNQIPGALVQRIEILTGGASSVYGADAIAGVVNFIMDTKFEGVSFEGNYSFYQHSNGNSAANIVRESGFALPESSVNTGYTKDFAFVMGSNFADDRGNATMYATYREVDGVLQKDYDYSACTLDSGTTAAPAFSCGGSGTSFPARFRAVDPITEDTTSYWLDPDTGAFGPGSFDTYNFGPLNYYMRPDERYTAGVFANLEMSEHAEVYGEFMFMQDRSVSQIAPSGVFGDFYTVSCANPLWTAEQFQAFCGNYGLTAADSTTIQINRRNIEGGGRQDDNEHTSYRTVIGVRGDLNDAWSYDAYGQYGTVTLSNVYRSDFSISRTGRALNVVTHPDTGLPACQAVVDRTDPTCVPYNIWTMGGVTPEGLQYIQIPLVSKGEVTERVVNASVTGDLGEYGVKLPSAESAVAVNFGVEWRSESTEYLPDGAYQAGDGAGQGSATLPLEGSFIARELFTEARIPIIEGRSLAQNLSAEVGYRYSEYSTDWETDTYKLGLEWSPIESVRLRGSYQHAVRVPNASELFSTQKVDLRGTVDPCASNVEAGELPALSAEQCARTGLDPSRYGEIEFNPANQYNGFVGGNTELEPETAETMSFGIALQPSFLPGLRFQVDYYDIKVEDAIQNPNADFTLITCALTGAPSVCSQVHRDSRGSLFDSNDGYVIDTLQNIGQIRTKGFDFDASYSFGIGDLGNMRVNFLGTLLDTFEVNPQPNVKYDCVGLYGSLCSSGLPNGSPMAEWKHKMSATWSMPWYGIDLTLGWRYIDAVKRDAEDQSQILGFLSVGTGVLPTDSELGSRSYVDLSASMTVAERYTFRLGATNLFDKDPPLNGSVTCPTGPCNGNTWPQLYDSLGRQVFATLKVEF